MQWIARAARSAAAALACLLVPAPPAFAGDLPEYRLKAAFLFNFAVFTEWPTETPATLSLCIVGKDPFGEEIDALQGKAVGERHIAVRKGVAPDAVASCQIVFITDSAHGALAGVLQGLHGLSVLTVADSPGAAAQGVALNMSVVNSRVSFEANLEAARAARLNLSSKLLRLATGVRQ
jgi:hypothetical protein